MGELKKLITGFKSFRKSFFQSEDKLYEKLGKKQTPKILLLGCCDSRVDPAIITDCRPGELFVMRNIANLVGPYNQNSHCDCVGAAIEYAVKFLEVEHVIVLGHSNCGGIGALMEDGNGKHSGEFVDGWIEISRPVIDRVRRDMANKSFEQQRRACEQASILASLDNLLSFPWIAERVENGRLALHGWYFDLSAGELLTYHPDMGKFEKIA